MKKVQLLLLTLLGISGGILQGQGTVVVCTPYAFVSNLTQALACYYDFGYQTSDNQFCWARFDNASPDIEIGAQPTKFNSTSFLPTHYDGNCTLCYPATTKIWFSGNSQVNTERINDTTQTPLAAAEFAQATSASSYVNCINQGAAPSCAINALGASRCPCPAPSAANPSSAYSTSMSFMKQKKTTSTGANPVGGTCNPKQ